MESFLLMSSNKYIELSVEQYKAMMNMLILLGDAGDAELNWLNKFIITCQGPNNFHSK